jgi:hypothetical protein
MGAAIRRDQHRRRAAVGHLQPRVWTSIEAARQ